jgi:hypothetical protein
MSISLALGPATPPPPPGPPAGIAISATHVPVTSAAITAPDKRNNNVEEQQSILFSCSFLLLK